MKKFVFSLALVKLSLLAGLTFLLFSTDQKTTGQTETESFSLPLTKVSPNPPGTPSSKIDEDKIDRPTSSPYTGDLAIFEEQNRDRNLQIDRVMEILKIENGKNVADIGAGSGWFTVRAAQKVGKEGKVFAVEINPEYLKYIDDRAKRENLPNIQTVLGTFDDPKLPLNSVDAVLILKAYHEFEEPVKVLKNVYKSLRKDGLVGIIDRNGKGDDHGIDKQKVIEEMKRAGYLISGDYDFVKADGMDYFLVFQKANM